MRDLTIISSLYYNQKAIVKEVHFRRNWKGVRQGYQHVIQKAMEGSTTGIQVNGRPVNTIRVADDTVLRAENLQQMIDRVVEIS